MKRSIYLFSGGTLSRSQNTLRLIPEKGRSQYIPVKAAEDLHAFGEVTLNTSLLSFLNKQGIPFHVYSHYGYYAGSFLPVKTQARGRTTLKQASYYNHSAKRLDLAKRILHGAFENLRQVLLYYQRKHKVITGTLNKLEKAQQLSKRNRSVEQLMATEGRARESYYQSWNAIIKNRDFRFVRRSRRPPQDPLNALISFGNTLLYTTCLSTLHATNLDPRIGFLHTTNDRSFSLHLDVAELFKPVIVDRLIFSLLNKKQIHKGHFEAANGGVYLNEAGRKQFLESYYKKLSETQLLRGQHLRASYKAIIRKECYKLEKHFVQGKVYQPYRLR